MGLWLLSLMAGVLTVLAPCVLPILPVILCRSVGGSRRRSRRIIGAFAVSIIFFTLLIKIFVMQLGVRPEMLTKISAGLLIFFGFSIVFPGIWNVLSKLIKVEQATDHAVQSVQPTIRGDFALGFLLGPIFNSCSPTYALLISTVLPSSFLIGLSYISAYIIGLSVALGSIVLIGRKFINKIRRLADPRGWFKVVLGVILIVVGVSVWMKWDKKVEIRLIEHNLFINTIQRELGVLQKVKSERGK